MSAELLFHRKNIEHGDIIVEMTIWRVPHSKDKPYGLKYSLVYIKAGERIIGYDNAESKGDHVHHRTKTKPYLFKDIESLIRDFHSDIAKEKRGEL